MKNKKNCWVIPTDKPSRLYEDVDNDLQLGYDFTIRQGMLQNQNIYITSDEEIEVGDWYINTFVSEIEQKPQTHTEKRHLINHQKDYRFKYCKKIILTTDQDLIKDGVQAIDDEFLEWFVKNPSCEEVKVEREKAIGYAGDRQRTFYGKYKIIIPSEEPKFNVTAKNHIPIFDDPFYDGKVNPLLIDEAGRWPKFKEELQTECYCEKTLWCDCKPKQETLSNPIIIVRNDDKEKFIHLSNGMYRTEWGILNNSISKTPLEAFDKSKFTFYYE